MDSIQRISVKVRHMLNALHCILFIPHEDCHLSGLIVLVTIIFDGCLSTCPNSSLPLCCPDPVKHWPTGFPHTSSPGLVSATVRISSWEPSRRCFVATPHSLTATAAPAILYLVISHPRVWDSTRSDDQKKVQIKDQINDSRASPSSFPILSSLSSSCIRRDGENAR